MDYVQEMSEGKENEMDTETYSESCQDSDIDGSEFPGCKVGVEDLLITLSFCLLVVRRNVGGQTQEC